MGYRSIKFFFTLMLIVVICYFSLSSASEKEIFDLSNAIVKVAKKAIPATVHIEVIERRETPAPFFPFLQNDPFFRYFFGFPNMRNKLGQEIKGIGSGIIIDENGYIITNNHVVQGATRIEVTLSDGRKFLAKLVGSDAKTDLAIIKISSESPLPYLKFGDSDKVEVGEWVIAIGHPRGLDQTVTHGIISAKHRRGIMDPSSYQDFLQTDAAINPGNSGGPLLNLMGEVIGVNTAIVSESGGFEGIGFAIPSNMALHVAKTIIEEGKVQRGWIGVIARDLTPEIAKSLNLSSTHGALIVDVQRGSPAEKAGLRPNDVVITFDSSQVIDSASLRNLVALVRPGKEVIVGIIRSGKREDLNVRVESLDMH